MSRGLIAVSVAEAELERAIASAQQAEEVADVVEFRLDYLESFDGESVPAVLEKLLGAVTKPIIITYRPEREGGRAGADRNFRRDVWSRIIEFAERQKDHRARIHYDIECDLVEYLAEKAPTLPWERIIASYHQVDSTPRDLWQIYEKLKSTPARILKIATFAREISDSLSVMRLLGRARDEGRNLIAIAMGTAGILTRVLGPAYGSFLTFASLGKGAETAPGQLTAAELRDLYRVDRLSERSVIVGLVGNPIGHSLSPLVHNVWFKLTGLDFVYVPFEVADVRRFFTEFVHPETRALSWNLRGLSITIPHKIAVMDLLDDVDPIARQVGAVNTVVMEGSKLRGYNTDVIGAMKPLEKRISLKGARVMLVGTGGAARAVAYGLKERGSKTIICARTVEKAKKLAEEVGAEACSLTDLPSVACDVIIHATPVGMSGYAAGSLIPREALCQKPLVYDLVYNPVETELLREARESGCETLSGLEMFLIQAAEQFKMWVSQKQSPT